MQLLSVAPEPVDYLDGPFPFWRLVLAAVATAALVPWCTVLAARAFGDRRNAKGAALLIPLLALLVALYQNPAVTKEALAKVADVVVQSDPPWDGARGPDNPIEEAVIRMAADKALQVLLEADVDWSEPDLNRLKSLLPRVPDMIVQRSRPIEELAQRIERQDGRLGALAQTHVGRRAQICLYADSINEDFAEHGLDNAESQSSYLAFLLIHEVFHVPRRAGGLLIDPVPGDSADGDRWVVHRDHIGLHLWTAHLAGLSVASEPPPDRLSGACAEIDRVRSLLGPESLYGQWLRDYFATDGESTLGPKRWGLRGTVDVPAECEAR